MSKNLPSRRWLRFGLRTFLCVVLMAAVGLWIHQWVKWPSRTLIEFDALLKQKRYAEAAARLEFEAGYIVSPGDPAHRAHVARSVISNYCEAQPRSFNDILDGRQVYRVKENAACYVDTGDLKAHFLIDSMTLERGKIRFKYRGPMSPQNLRFEDGKWIRNVIPFGYPRMSAN